MFANFDLFPNFKNALINLLNERTLLQRLRNPQVNQE